MLLTNQYTTDLKQIKRQKRPVGNNAYKGEPFYYKDIVCAFDIETSKIKYKEEYDKIKKEIVPRYQSFMYVWQFQMGLEYTIVGRTWEEFLKICQQICSLLRDNERLVIYVHNLSYEFTFLSGIYHFKPEEVFAVDKRAILKCTMFNKLEFRCSYRLSNMSLLEFTKAENVEHRKYSEKYDFDYNIIRYPWTPLDSDELLYCQNDVLGLVEAVHSRLKNYNDTLYTIPLTSTGYVRREAKKAMRGVNRTWLREIMPRYEVYKALREAFRGGNTHANRYYVGNIVENVKTMDLESAYPAAQACFKFPMTPFKPVEEKYISYDRLTDLLNKGKALLMRVAFYDFKLKSKYWGFPYLAKAKCRECVGTIEDNGRLLQGQYIETTITDIDLKIIIDEYDIKDILFINCYYSNYDYLPDCYLELLKVWYTKKTELKGDDAHEYEYSRLKALLNSIYGMTAQDPVKESNLYIDVEAFENREAVQEYIGNNIDDLDLFVIDNRKSVEELLEEHNKRAFLPYQWGVWTTCYCRLMLEKGLKLAGDNAIYCDTDSVKYLGSVDFTDYNQRQKAIAKEKGFSAIDNAGNRHYIGMFTPDKDYNRFITWGAKKYAFTYIKDGKEKVGVTISGVNKKLGGEELEEQGGLNALLNSGDGPSFTFVKAGGTESVYNDFPEIKEIEAEGRMIPITRNVVIKDSTYQLGIIPEYNRLLQDCHLLLKCLDMD